MDVNHTHSSSGEGESFQSNHGSCGEGLISPPPHDKEPVTELRTQSCLTFHPITFLTISDEHRKALQLGRKNQWHRNHFSTSSHVFKGNPGGQQRERPRPAPEGSAW